jgi:anaerobic selenocysteine-containing dehydrogenase
VSWEEAIAFVADRLGALREVRGPDAFSLAWGDWLAKLHTCAMLGFCFETIGSSTRTGNGSEEVSAGISAAFGTGTRSLTEEDFELSELLVTMGRNLEANGSVWHHRSYNENPSAGTAKHVDIIAKQLPSLTRYLPEIADTFVIVQDRVHSEMTSSPTSSCRRRPGARTIRS